MKLKQLTPLMVATGLTAMSGFAQAAELEVTVQNLTRGIYFTPILISAHSSDASLFELGETATIELQAMAEGGDISGCYSRNPSGLTQVFGFNKFKFFFRLFRNPRNRRKS